MKKVIEVVAGVIKKDDLFFIAKRKNKGELALKWEFPGGKVELNETHQDTLKRELLEELNIHVQVGDFITTVDHEYDSFIIKLDVYYASIVSGEIILNDHIDYKWITKELIYKYDLAEADKPIIDYL